MSDAAVDKPGRIGKLGYGSVTRLQLTAVAHSKVGAAHEEGFGGDHRRRSTVKHLLALVSDSLKLCDARHQCVLDLA